MKVLFLCHGNVNRSAAGEIILKKMRPGWEVKSAALKETIGGDITSKKMRGALNVAGYETLGIRSSPISKEDMDWADVVFYMDNGNEKRLLERFGSMYAEKSVRISTLIGEKKIPDPAFCKGDSMHHDVVRMIQRCLEIFVSDKQ